MTKEERDMRDIPQSGQKGAENPKDRGSALERFPDSREMAGWHA